MGPTPFYGARAENPQKADFAMKQTNICRLSGDVIKGGIVCSIGFYPSYGSLGYALVMPLMLVNKSCAFREIKKCFNDNITENFLPNAPVKEL